MTILIISSKRDGHINSVVDYLEKMGCHWVRINIEDMACNVTMSLTPQDKTGIITITDSERSFNLESVSAVWYRKPDPLNLSHFNLPRAGLDYVEAEFNEVVQGIYALLNDRKWINNPFSSRLAHRKMLQLHIAHKVGLRTPASIITNRVEDALTFAESVNWDLAIKSLGAISVAEHGENEVLEYGIFTRRINKEELLVVADKISHMPVLFQQYIEKEVEFRVTVVGKEAFVCKIYSQENPLTKEDMRFDVRQLKHEICHCPELEEKLFKYLHYFGLNFGCFDIALDKNGQYVFFECNPNGQWLWIEELTKAPISQAIANLLKY